MKRNWPIWTLRLTGAAILLDVILAILAGHQSSDCGGGSDLGGLAPLLVFLWPWLPFAVIGVASWEGRRRGRVHAGGIGGAGFFLVFCTHAWVLLTALGHSSGCGWIM
jgi:hypothetical protein